MEVTLCKNPGSILKQSQAVRLRPTPSEDESLVCGGFWMISGEILHCA